MLSLEKESFCDINRSRSVSVGLQSPSILVYTMHFLIKMMRYLTGVLNCLLKPIKRSSFFIAQTFQYQTKLKYKS